MVKNILNTFMDKLLNFPLWVKQVIYLRLHKNLALYLSDDLVHTKEEDLFNIHVPVLSYLGRTELAERKSGCDNNVYNFLANASDGLNILEMSMNNFWTMEEVAGYYVFCLEQNFIKLPDSVYIQGMAGFMSGKFRTGEYFKRTGKIDVDQLERAIMKQKELADKGNPLKIAEIMISLGFVTEKDTSSLLVIKEEAKKRFILDASIIPKEAAAAPTPAAPPAANAELELYKNENAKLKEQNAKLREQLTKILAFVKKNG